MSKTGKPIETESRLVVARGWGKVMGVRFLLGVVMMIWNSIVVMGTQPHKYTKTH